MTRGLFVAACVLMLAACSNSDQSRSPATVPVPAASSPVALATPVTPVTPVDPAGMARYDGYGDMRFGMHEATFDKAWGGELKGAPEQGSSCFYKRPKWVKTPADFGFMFEGDRFVRYDVGSAKETAPGGGKVGMSEAQIRMLYGDRVAEQPHKYVDGAKYLRVTEFRVGGVLLFETDEHGKVTRWHVGVSPQVDYVEGCS